MGPPPAVAAVRRAVRTALASDPPLTAGDLVLVACSGGADSLALAAATAFAAPRLGLRVGGVTVDHGLQDGSSARAAEVAATMRGLGLDPVEVVRVAVAGAGGPEAAARTARHAALADAAQRWGCAAVLLAHSRDDQAETVLLGLARGSGARSLAGMAPVSGLLRRPFLDLDRSVLRAACLASDLVPWDDPQNEDPAFTRVRVRRHVLPLLEREIGPGVAAALARTARLVRADADALDDIARAAAAAALRADGLDVAALVALPTAVRTRVLRGAALAAGSPASALTATHVEALDALVTAWHGQGPLDLPGGVRAARAYGRLTVDRADEE